MCPFSHTLLRLPKITHISRRNLRLFSPTSFYPKSNSFLQPSPPHTDSARCLSLFSEDILNSRVASQVSSIVTHNEYVFVLQDKLIGFHDLTGLPWWAVIVVSTVALRTFFIFPLATHHQHVIARLTNLNVELDTTAKDEITKSVAKLAKEKNWDSKTIDDRYQREILNRRHELYLKYNCNPKKCFILALFQMPLWMAMSGAIRNISAMEPIRDVTAIQAYLEMKASGFSILKDLTVADGTFTLPALIVVTNLLIIQLNDMSGLHSNNNLRFIILVLMRCFTIISFSFIMHAPKCMSLYWLTSSLCGLLQTFLFVHPKTRRWLRIPHTDRLRPDPLKHIKNRFKSIYYFLKY